MKVSCVLEASEVNGEPDIIVFPEYIAKIEVAKACATHPRAVVVGAIEEHGYCWGIMWHEGRNQVDYLKVTSDGQTQASPNYDQRPIYETPELALGMLICLDVQESRFRPKVLNALRASSAKRKLLCIPADMGGHCFGGDKLSPDLRGLDVVVCNNNRTHQDYRCKSFIADRSGRKVRIQKDLEPIRAILG